MTYCSGAEDASGAGLNTTKKHQHQLWWMIGWRRTVATLNTDPPPEVIVLAIPPPTLVTCVAILPPTDVISVTTDAAPPEHRRANSVRRSWRWEGETYW